MYPIMAILELAKREEPELAVWSDGFLCSSVVGVIPCRSSIFYLSGPVDSIACELEVT
jgi:hypothetical protein